MGKKLIYIYSISDPDTSEIRYIGQTIDFQNRCKEHLTETDIKEKHDWICELLSRNKLPIFTIVDTFYFTTYSENNLREKYHAIEAFENGNRLFNSKRLYTITEEKFGVHSYVTPKVKKAILQMAINEQRSESFIISRLLNKMFDPIEENICKK